MKAATYRKSSMMSRCVFANTNQQSIRVTGEREREAIRHIGQTGIQADLERGGREKERGMQADLESEGRERERERGMQADLERERERERERGMQADLEREGRERERDRERGDQTHRTDRHTGRLGERGEREREKERERERGDQTQRTYRQTWRDRRTEREREYFFPPSDSAVPGRVKSAFSEVIPGKVRTFFCTHKNKK